MKSQPMNTHTYTPRKQPQVTEGGPLTSKSCADLAFILSYFQMIYDLNNLLAEAGDLFKS